MSVRYSIKNSLNKTKSNKVLIITDDEYKANAIAGNISLTKYNTQIININYVSDNNILKSIACSKYILFDALYKILYKVNFKNKKAFYIVDEFMILKPLSDKSDKKTMKLISTVEKILVCNEAVKNDIHKQLGCELSKVILFPNITTSLFSKTQYKNESLKLKKNAFDMMKKEMVLYIPQKTKSRKIIKRQKLELQTLKSKLKKDQVLFYTHYNKKIKYEDGEIDLDDIGYYILACDIFITDGAKEIMSAKFLNKEVIFSDERNYFYEILNSSDTNFNELFDYSKNNSLRNALINLLEENYD